MNTSIREMLRPECTKIEVAVETKEDVLRYVGDLAVEQLALPSAAAVCEALVEREQLASTGIGFGIAIPHCRLEECEQVSATLIRLAAPIDFGAIDNEPVDLICALLVPSDGADQHLRALSVLARRFSEPEFRDALRAAKDERSLYDAATSYDTDT